VLIVVVLYFKVPAISTMFNRTNDSKDPFSPDGEVSKSVPIIEHEGPILDSQIKVTKYGKYLMYTRFEFD